MKLSIRLVGLLGGAAAAAVVGALFVGASSASSPAGTFTVRTVKERGSSWIAASSKGMTVGRLSPGDRLVETNEVVRDGRAKGRFVVTAIVASPRTVAADRAIGMFSGVYRFSDGDLYVEGVVSFGTTTGKGVIVGGTGRFAGARGTLAAGPGKDVLRVLS